jgi:hypothetical protein
VIEPAGRQFERDECVALYCAAMVQSTGRKFKVERIDAQGVVDSKRSAPSPLRFTMMDTARMSPRVVSWLAGLAVSMPTLRVFNIAIAAGD